MYIIIYVHYFFHLSECSTLDEAVTVDLWSDTSNCKEPRYSITIIDIKKSEQTTHNGKFAVFIIPQGMYFGNIYYLLRFLLFLDITKEFLNDFPYLGCENESTYTSDSGRKGLAEVAGFNRLAIVALHRGHIYKDMEEIKAELSQKVMELAPSEQRKNSQVRILTRLSAGQLCFSYYSFNCL